MALRLAKTTEEGFSVEYWRVSPSIHVDMVEHAATAQVIAYKDATARQAGKRPVEVHGPVMEGYDEVRSVTISGAEFTAGMSGGDFRDQMYAALKTKPFFTGAEDV
jgi:hypothetical protein